MLMQRLGQVDALFSCVSLLVHATDCTIDILKDFENASPRLNPLFHKPENVSGIVVIAYRSLTSF